MYDYTRLPTLVLNEIFGYLSVKERIKAKSVCRTWKTEVELKEKNLDELIIHLGPFLWNAKWSQTNNGGLMKYENSFGVKNLDIFKHPLASRLLKRTKKLAVVHYHNCYNPTRLISNLDQCVSLFRGCEEIEIQNFNFELQTITLNLAKLKKLVLKNSQIKKLVLTNCPALELLFWNLRVEEIHFGSAKKLKHLMAYGWPASFSLSGRFDSLEYLNLFMRQDSHLNDRLLKVMPKLKRLVIYSYDLQADLAIIREHQARGYLGKLKILYSGFSEPNKLQLGHLCPTGYVPLNQCEVTLFDNYSKLEENLIWKVGINYWTLFEQFKILPANFVERFPEPSMIEISRVASYMHLFEFLKCYPCVVQLKLHFSKVDADLILSFMHFAQPSLRELCIVEERSSKLIDIDLSFIRRFELVILLVESTNLPVKFLRKLAAQIGSRFSPRGFLFKLIHTGSTMEIFFFDQAISFIDNTRNIPYSFATFEQLITSIQNDPFVRPFLTL